MNIKTIVSPMYYLVKQTYMHACGFALITFLGLTLIVNMPIPK